MIKVELSPPAGVRQNSLAHSEYGQHSVLERKSCAGFHLKLVGAEKTTTGNGKSDLISKYIINGTTVLFFFLRVNLKRARNAHTIQSSS